MCIVIEIKLDSKETELNNEDKQCCWWCFMVNEIKFYSQETELNNEEKHFLLAVERGDIPTARHCLEESQIYFNININCVDTLGRSALLIAIENENIEMIGNLFNFLFYLIILLTNFNRLMISVRFIFLK